MLNHFEVHRSKNKFATIKTALRVVVFIAAIFGVFSAGIMIFMPEKLTQIYSNMSAFASGNYKIPQSPEPSNSTSADVKMLKSFSKVFVNIAKQTRPALVYIVSTRQVTQNPAENFFGPFGPFMPQQPDRGLQQGAGSGFIIDLKNGYVITNNHVVEGAKELEVKTFDERKFKAKVVGADKSVDVAVIKLENFAPNSLKQVSFADSDKVEVGDWSVALGAPFELPQTLTVGVVSALGRGQILGKDSLEDFIQTDAAINPGNSGGPLLNIDGQVIGMNTAIYSRSGGFAGIGFAVPANMVKVASEMLINDGKLTRGFLGITMSDVKDLSEDVKKNLDITESNDGAVVMAVIPNSPADKSGIKPYDIIKSLNGTLVLNGSVLRNHVAFIKPGTEIKLGIVREGKVKDLTLKVGTYSNEAFANRGRPNKNGDSDSEKSSILDDFGVQVQPINKDLKAEFKLKASTGLIIVAVADSSPAQMLDLNRGDVIIEVGRKPVKSVKELENAIKNAKEKQRDLLLYIERDGRNQLVVVRGW